MSLKTIVNSPDWLEVEALIEQKLEQLALDFPTQTTEKFIAIHALANKKAYNLLTEWLKEMEFYKGEDRPSVKRDMR